MTNLFEKLIFGHRKTVLFLFGLATIFLTFEMTKIEIDAGFEKLLPLQHPYIKTFTEHQAEFGGANRLLIAIRAREGDIFTPEFFATLKEVTDEVFFLPGVNRSTVQSIYTPNVRFIEIVEGGFTGGNVIPADFSPTPERLAQVRENILKSGTVGRLVANDFTAAMITAQLVENDPATGERLDYIQVAERLESKIRDPYKTDDIDIHIIGFAKMMGDVSEGASGVVLFLFIAFVISGILVYLVTQSVRLTFYPLLCAAVAVVWNLGLLSLFGFGIDPMSLLVPFLVLAIGVSHGVQMINAVGAEAFRTEHGLTAAKNAFRQLVVPGIIALISDTAGFLTLLAIDVGIIQELAITASLGVMAIVFTNLILLPVTLSYVPCDAVYRSKLERAARQKEWAWVLIGQFSRTKMATIAIVIAVGLGAWGLYEGRNIAIGDIHDGVPELRPESRYNQDIAQITDKFSIGLDIISVIVETIPDGCIEHDVMDRIDQFQWKMANVEGVQSTISLPQVAKIINAGWNEGNLKWRVLPRNPASMSQAVMSVETSTGLLNRDCSVMPVMIFLEDHKAETIERVVEEVKAFAQEHDSDRHRFRLASANVGVMAATNEVVREAQVWMLVYIYAVVTLLCFATFRSWRALVCIILPLSLVSILSYGLMSVLEIGLKTTTLPVTALGVGIGVDYGIYIFSRLRTGLEKGYSLAESYHHTLRITGNAVIVTGLTLAFGVSTWIFSALQFQADMGILLGFMFLANMLGAVLLLPALARFVYGAREKSAA